MRHARTRKLQLSGPTVHSLDCDGILRVSFSLFCNANTYRYLISNVYRNSGNNGWLISDLIYCRFGCL